MMRDVVIGTVTGISAVVAMSLMTPRASAPLPAIRSLPAFERDDLALPLAPTTRPDPARARLETVIGLASPGSSVKDVLEYVARETGANMVVNWRALEMAGIAGDAPVTLELRRVPGRVVLDEVLSQVGGGVIKLGYRVVDGVVVVSTADELRRYKETRVYDVRDLIGGPGGLDEITKLLRHVTEPAGWDEPGGSYQWLGAMNGRLIVTDTPEMHARVVELLGGLRGTR
jgi:hypothetical protein